MRLRPSSGGCARTLAIATAVLGWAGLAAQPSTARESPVAGFRIDAGVGTATPGSDARSPVVAAGRIWQLFGSLSPIGHLTLRSWPVSGGTAESVRLAPVPARAVRPAPGTVDRYDGLPNEVVEDLGVAGGRVYVRGSVCAEDAPQSCEPALRTFVFRAGDGSLQQAFPWGQGPMLASLQPGVLLMQPTADGLLLSDPETGAHYGPRRLSDPNGTFAGRYSVQDVSRGREVIDIESGGVRYRVSDRSILKRAGQPHGAVRGVALQPDGSLAVRVAVPTDVPARLKRRLRRGLVPVFVDADGVVRRAAPRLEGARAVSVVPSARRVVVAADGGVRRVHGARRPVCTGAWVVDRGGRRGFALSSGPEARRIRVAGTPVFWDGTIGIWARKTRRGRTSSYIVRRLRSVRLSRSTWPSCRGAASSRQLSTAFED